MVQAEVSSIKGDLVYTFQKRWRSFEKDDKQLTINEPYDPSGQSEWWCDANFDDLPCDSMHRLIIHSRHLRNANLPNWKKSISRLIGNFTQIWPKYLLINIASLRLVSDFPQLPFHFLRQRSLKGKIELERKKNLSKIISTSTSKQFQPLLNGSIYSMRN